MSADTKKPNRKAINKMVSIFDKHLEILEHVKEDKGMGSHSEVVRSALVFFHDKMYPNYIFHLTPAATKKKKLADDLAAKEAVTIEEIAASLHAPIVIHSNGQKYLIVWGWSNMMRKLVLENAKELLANNPDLVDLHAIQLKTRGMPEKFSDEDIDSIGSFPSGFSKVQE